MKALIVGSGGREHAIGWKLEQSNLITSFLVWSKSPTLLQLGKDIGLPQTASYAEVVDAAKQEGVDFVVVGPEGPLAEGFADVCSESGLPCFGPTKAAALLEASKSFAKEVMLEAKIPTSKYTDASSEEECRKVALEMLEATGGTVLKASGLAGGKGVFVCRSEQDVKNGIQRLFGESMRSASEKVVVEEILEGRECSFFTFIGDKGAVPIGFAVDFKRLKDGDVGPNTGGMGCYTPVQWLPENASETVMELIVEPLLKGLNRRGVPYTGCLYVGIMWGSEGPKVVEFNVRLGDPEAQVLAIQDDRDWGELIAGVLGLVPAKKWGSLSRAGSSVCVVMASEGYPYGGVKEESPVLPADIFKVGPAACTAFGASVVKNGGDLCVGSGRVLSIAAKGASFSEARGRAYEQVSALASDWPGVQYRTDIAQKAMSEE